MTSLLGVPGGPSQRGTASFAFCDDPHGEPVLVDVDGGPDEVLQAAIRYRPDVHPPMHRTAAVYELEGTLARAGWRTIGPVLWGEDEARVRVERMPT